MIMVPALRAAALAVSVAEARIFAVRFTFGATLCALIAFGIKLVMGLL